jgi:hypothetical protein
MAPTTNSPELWNSLEAAKLLASLLTPVLLLVLGIWVHRVSKRFDAAQWKNQKVVEKRLDVYAQLAPLLNRLLCFYTYVGDWKELTPPTIVQTKRDIDRIFYVNQYVLSTEVASRYHEFIALCFDMKRGHGATLYESRLLTSAKPRQQLPGWDSEWDGLFAEQGVNPKSTIDESYRGLMDQVARELGVAGRSA